MKEKWMEMLREWGGHEPAQILIIIVAAWMVYEMIRHLVPRVTGRVRGKDRFYTLPWIPLLRLAIILAALMLIVPLVIEPTRENVLALVGASALAIGFAIKDYISCLIAGIIFMFERPYRVGDWIEIGGTYGEVTHLGLRAVLIRTIDANDITIPHSALWHDQLSNATRRRA
jgi:small-conductance mechanosensitive channel